MAKRTARMIGAGAMFALIAPVSAIAEPITNLCLRGGTAPAACECATAAMEQTLPPTDFALYTELSDVYLAARRDGASADEAWMTAAEIVGSENGTGRDMMFAEAQLMAVLHRDAIRACR